MPMGLVKTIPNTRSTVVQTTSVAGESRHTLTSQLQISQERIPSNLHPSLTRVSLSQTGSSSSSKITTTALSLRINVSRLTITISLPLSSTRLCSVSIRQKFRATFANPSQRWKEMLQMWNDLRKWVLAVQDLGDVQGTGLWQGCQFVLLLVR